LHETKEVHSFPNTLFHKGVWTTLKEMVLATVKHVTTLEGSLPDQSLFL